jgi:hypothetical protein
LRNIFIFNSALAANTLWRVLMKKGIWHTIIKDKYLPYTSVATWFRSSSSRMSTTSLTWKNLLKALPIITQWLSWSPGSGQSIIIGKDMILGWGPLLSCLPHSLLSYIKETLHFYIRLVEGLIPGSLGTLWKESGELALPGDWL